MWVTKKTQYGGDVVMFLPNKTIKSKNLIIRKKNCGSEKKHNMGEML